jgi:hypothetical protein
VGGCSNSQPCFNTGIVLTIRAVSNFPALLRASVRAATSLFWVMLDYVGLLKR